ncbi:hypothetical protein ONC83_002970 [Listeria monocytogenes]|nr:hypothetical protein [Listeria monocytogenes]
MQKTHRGNGFIIIENEGEFQISWLQGPFNQPVSYPITKEHMVKALRTEKDAYEVMIFTETGNWPPTKNEKAKISKEFIQQFPELLISIPTNQDLFTAKELEILLPLAEKKLRSRKK